MKLLYRGSEDRSREDFWTGGKKTEDSSYEWWKERAAQSGTATTNSAGNTTNGHQGLGTSSGDLNDAGKKIAETVSDNIFLTSALAAALQAVFGFLGYAGRAMGASIVKIIDRRFPHE